MWILIAIPDPNEAEDLQARLETEGYTVKKVFDGVKAEVEALSNAYDLLIIDAVLPRQGGFTLVRHLRAAKIQTPILMFTALSDVDDRVHGLDAGADDYLVKPFFFQELFARLRALARRTPTIQQRRLLIIGPVKIDLERHTLTVENKAVFLGPKEFAILKLLMDRANVVVTRTTLAERIWGSAFISDDVINVTIGRLRKKLHRTAAKKAIIIETVRGIGYRLKTTIDNSSSDVDA